MTRSMGTGGPGAGRQQPDLDVSAAAPEAERPRAVPGEPRASMLTWAPPPVRSWTRSGRSSPGAARDGRRGRWPPQGVGRQVDGDDVGTAGDRSRHRGQPHPAAPEHHDALTGLHVGPDRHRSVCRGHPAAETRGLCGGHVVRQGDEVGRGRVDDDALGEGPGSLNPGWRWCGQTWPSPPGTPGTRRRRRRRGGDPAPDPAAVDPVADRLHRAGELMARDVGKPTMSVSWPSQPCQSLRHSPLASTRTTAHRGCDRVRDVGDRERAAERGIRQCTHGSTVPARVPARRAPADPTVSTVSTGADRDRRGAVSRPRVGALPGGVAPRRSETSVKPSERSVEAPTEAPAAGAVDEDRHGRVEVGAAGDELGERDVVGAGDHPAATSPALRMSTSCTAPAAIASSACSTVSRLARATWSGCAAMAPSGVGEVPDDVVEADACDPCGDLLLEPLGRDEDDAVGGGEDHADRLGHPAVGGHVDGAREVAGGELRGSRASWIRAPRATSCSNSSQLSAGTVVSSSRSWRSWRLRVAS